MQLSINIPVEGQANSGTADHRQETALIQAAQQNSAEFAPLYEKYRDSIYAYLRTRTGNADDAADLTQQVFLQALAALPRYRIGPVPFAAWLVRIARNIAANYHKRHRHTITWDLVPEILQPTVQHDMDANLVRQDILIQLRDVLRTCSPTTREILALHFAARLTVTETAIAVGKSEAAVKKQLTRTLRQLKDIYNTGHPAQKEGNNDTF